MANDLLHVKAKIDRAENFIPVIAAQIQSFLDSRPYTIWREIDERRGGINCKVRYNRMVPNAIAIDSGQSINLMRSALDNLVCALALRLDPQVSTRSVSFPIAHSEQSLYDERGNFFKKLKLLSKADKDKILALKPYKGGDDLLYALNELRQLDFHNRLIRMAGFVGSVSIPNGFGSCEIGGDVNTWGSIEDERTIIWFDGDFEFNFSLSICFNEIGHTKTEPIPALLKKFVERCRQVVAQFD